MLMGAGDGSSLLLEKMTSLVLVAFIARELSSHQRFSLFISGWSAEFLTLTVEMDDYISVLVNKEGHVTALLAMLG